MAFRKKSIWDLFSKGKDSKNVHHYHVHYYPLPLNIIEPPLLAPEKKTLEQIHDEKFRSLGWSEEEFTVPDPKIIYPSKLDSIWKDENKLTHLWDSTLFESKPSSESNGILVQVPLHQQIIFQVPKEKEESSFLSSLLQKIRNIKKFLFSSRLENHEHEWEERSDKKSSITDLTEYLYYMNKKKGKES